MSLLEWMLVAAGVTVLLYVAFVAALALSGRRGSARALAGFVPDCLVLFRRLLGDSRLPRTRKLVLAALVAYLAMPVDLVPDFVPVAGQLDDAIIVVLVLRHVIRGAGPDVIREHWPGPPASVDALLQLAYR